MKTIKSVAKFFSEANGKKVSRVVVGGPCVEDWPEVSDSIKKQLIEQGCPAENIIEDDVRLSIKGSTQYWLKPKIYKYLTGKFIARSSDYIFEYENPKDTSQVLRSFGKRKGLKVEDNTLILTSFSGTEFRYSII